MIWLYPVDTISALLQGSSLHDNFGLLIVYLLFTVNQCRSQPLFKKLVKPKKTKSRMSFQAIHGYCSNVVLNRDIWHTIRPRFYPDFDTYRSEIISSLKSAVIHGRDQIPLREGWNWVSVHGRKENRKAKSLTNRLRIPQFMTSKIFKYGTIKNRVNLAYGLTLIILSI